VEALELRLLEAVVDDQTHPEKGVSMLQLLAELAPMLGLLGTVTGMIETFQVITQFGNGDPKVMAGGNSMGVGAKGVGLGGGKPLALGANEVRAQGGGSRHILENQGFGFGVGQERREKYKKKGNRKKK
ncbi:flagellar motor protein MotA, partial [Vibrio parahaemolyticus]|uniref:MotA/TolQ/ExbB proton channel family protein n=1 Tax=Vibrio parahaemolyticus TaxID=670 RepID=UPI00062B1CF2